MNDPSPTNAHFPIVAVGASAGGVAALQDFVGNLAGDAHVAVIVVLHLPADANSHLAGLLDQICPLPVRPICDGMPLEAGTVAVLPPGSTVRLEGDCLHLSERQAGTRWRPVDALFTSLGTEARERAVAVVLSGTGDNGSIALPAIKQAGGLVLVQDVTEAEYQDMPRHAIASGAADQVGPAADLARAVNTWSRRLRQMVTGTDVDGASIDRILALIQAHTGRDYSGYKPGTIERRVQRRASMCFCETIPAYLDFLCQNDQEVDRLAADLLIGVTAFFRDERMWEHLGASILADLLEKAETGEPFRAWVAGCATGEEAYSLAILVTEELERRNLQRPVQIFATDLDPHACDQARRGLFPAALLSGLSDQRLRDRFTRDNGAYRIAQPIRDMITFAPHNLLRDPPFSQLDLITCRNVLIYLDTPAQEQLLGTFHFALRRQGVLVLGSSETAQRHEDLFRLIDESCRCYRRRDTPSPAPSQSYRSRRCYLRAPSKPRPPADTQSTAEHHYLAQDLAQHHFAPAFVLVDTDHQIHYYSGPTARFLQQPDGAPNDDLLAICDPELRPRLHAGLSRAWSTEAALILYYSDDDDTPIEVTVRPVAGRHNERLGMVSFRPRPETNANAASTAVAKGDLTADQALQALDQELRATREELSSSIEELETSNEELKASNEETRSMYEELQSANEELESSREELQSVNEELNVVNERLQIKIGELAETNDVLANLLSSTNLPTLFLDRELRIQRFTPAAERLLRLIAGDVGRSFDDLADRISDGRIVDDARNVLATLVPSECEVQANSGAWYLLRIHPYRTADDRIDGVVITLSDITALKQAEERIRQRELQYRSIFDNAAVGIAQLDHNGRIHTHNRTFITITGLPHHLLVDRPLADFFDPESAQILTTALTRISGDGSEVHELPLRRDGHERWLRLTMSTIDDSIDGMVVLIEDISDRHRVESRLRRRSEDLQRSNEDLNHFATMASHDLQAPLRVVGTYIDLVNELGDELGDEEKNRYLGVITANVHRMRRMIIDLLAYARAELAEEHLRPCSCTEVVGAVSANLKDEISAHEVAFTVDELPIVHAPPRLLEQVFQNLIDNAIKYRCEDRTPRITITASRGDEAWLIHVTDNGRGIPLGKRERVFDIFDRAGASSEPGTGVGLAICRKGIERLGGHIWIEDPPDGDGTTFTFSIPDRADDTTTDSAS